MKINSYNSQFPCSFYTVGEAYTFYINNRNLSHLERADDDVVNTYGSILSRYTTNEQFVNETDGKWYSLIRIVGVVVDTTNTDMITVMFKTNDERYVVNKYIVGSTNVFTNDKDDIVPVTTLDFKLNF